MAKRDEAKERRLKIIIGIMISVFMVTSIGGVLIYNTPVETENKFKLNVSGKEYTVTSEYPYYFINVGEKKVRFYNLPSGLEKINIDDNVIRRLKNSQTIYLTFDPYQQELGQIDKTRLDLTSDMAAFSLYPVSAVTTESDAYNLPVVTCNNASTYAVVVEFKTSNITNINLNGNCITISARGFDFQRVRDKLLYYLYDIL